jgi:L-serine dehydratase
MTVDGLCVDRTRVPPGPVAFDELFKIGIGPSSSHTIGPMRAAANFVLDLRPEWSSVHRISATALGSLAWTGKGHATDKAMILGLAGHRPETIAPDDVEQIVGEVVASQGLVLPDGRVVDFLVDRDIVFDTVSICDRHPNTMIFEAFAACGRSLRRQVWFSLGGGLVKQDGVAAATERDAAFVPFPYSSAYNLLEIGRANRLRIDEIVFANETARSKGDVLRAIDEIADVMLACIERGLVSSGELPGGLSVRRRAKNLYEKLRSEQGGNNPSVMDTMNYVSAFAIAVNEENAAGGRVVTAPTNGAAGVCPAVLRYYTDFCAGASRQGIHRFFLTATAIGGIIKRNASISGAEVGCQGEVGSAAAMAAGGLASALGGSNEQIENAAEIAMEHHLGMTCDPVGGLVQIPCIERNAFGAIKAISAASLALQGDGLHRVTLDQVIETMRQTGVDMSSRYRETSRGGLAVNVPEC